MLKSLFQERGAIFFFSFLGFAFVLYIALALNQSSIGKWEEFYPYSPVEQPIDFGAARSIRSDEWNTWTPWVVNQVLKEGPDKNLNVGGGSAPLISTVPVSDWTAFAQPKYYGYYIFDLERGFSWHWAFKTFGLIGIFAWLALLLTRGAVFVSILAGIWIWGSSATQWWYSSYMPETYISFAGTLVGYYYWLTSRTFVVMTAGALAFVFAAFTLILQIYPPFLIPFAGLGMLVALALSFEYKGFFDRPILRFAIAGASLLIFVVVAFLWYHQSNGVISLVSNTVYPGHRLSNPGTISAARYISGYFEWMRLGESSVPLPPSNASEASSFILIFPIVFMLVIRDAIQRRRVSPTVIALLSFCFLMSFWAIGPEQGVVPDILATLGLNRVPPERVILTVGPASILAAVVYMSGGKPENGVGQTKWGLFAFLSVVWFSMLALGLYLRSQDPVFFTWPRMTAGLLVVGLIAAGLFLRKSLLVGVAILFAVVPSLTVNPLMTGMSSVMEKPILKQAAKYSTRNVDRWAVFGDFVFSQGLKMKGLDVITGSQMVPNTFISAQMDPDSRYAAVWNRYAHVVFRSEPSKEQPEYNLIQPDMYSISLNVCGPYLKNLKVTRVAYTVDVPIQDLSCLSEIPSIEGSGVRLFKVKH